MKYIALTCPVGQHAVCMPDKAPASACMAPVKSNPLHSLALYQEARDGACSKVSIVIK